MIQLELNRKTAISLGCALLDAGIIASNDDMVYVGNKDFDPVLDSLFKITVTHKDGGPIRWQRRIDADTGESV